MLIEGRQEFEVIYKKLKPYGLFNGLTFLLYQWLWLGQASFALASYTSLGGMKPDYICSDPVYENVTDRCILLHNCNITNQFYSVYEEFEWDCIDMQIPFTVASFTYLPVLLSFLLAGQLGDRFGRKRMAFWALVLYHVLCVLVATAPSWQFYLAVSLARGFVWPIYDCGLTMMVIETVGKKHRLLQTFSLQWTLAYMGAALICYLVGTWRGVVWVSTAISLPTLVFFFFLPESPRWLVQKQCYKEAAKALNTIAKWIRQKGVLFTPDELKSIEVDKDHHTSIFDAFKLLRNCTLLLYTVSLVVISSAARITRDIVLMNVTELAGNPFLNASFFGLLRIWAPLAVIVERKWQWFGRRIQLLCPLFIVFLCFQIVVLIYAFGFYGQLGLLCTGFTLFGYALTLSLVSVAHDQITCEVYPTPMRATGDSVIKFLATIIAMVGPQLVYLRNVWPGLPYVGSAVATGIAVTLGFFILPETRQRSLPDTFKAAVNDQNDETQV